jgi:hypothetical protein
MKRATAPTHKVHARRWRRGMWLAAAPLAAAIIHPTSTCAAQNASQQSVSIPLTVQSGIPLHITLDKQVPMQAGAKIEGTVTDPVYAFDQMVIPSGSKVLGKVASVVPVDRKVRAHSILGGDFTPWKTPHIELDTLVLKNGQRYSISTKVTQGAPQMVHLTATPGKAATKTGIVSRTLHRVRSQIHAAHQQASQAIGTPGKWNRIKLWAGTQVERRLPYHRQRIQAGTVYSAELTSPLNMGNKQLPVQALNQVGTAPPPGSVVHACLLTPLDSSTAKRGTPVQAILTEPLFSAKHQLILPEGSLMQGIVVRARPARRLHHNGELRFTFQRIEPVRAQPRSVEGSLEGVAVDKRENLNLDSEGGAKAENSKGHYLAPALSLAIAHSAADTGDGPGSAVGNNSAGAAPSAVYGGMGFGLLGSLAVMAIASQPVGAAFAYYGSALSIYSQWLRRGQDVVFARDTSMEIRFGTHGAAQPAPRPAGVSAVATASKSAADPHSNPSKN